MTYRYYDGSVFECAEYNEVNMIVNTVNCKGFMGAGLALEYKLRYPTMYEDYKSKCSNKQIKTGQLDVYSESQIKILNFPTKDDWKKPSNISWIKQGLQFFIKNYKSYDIKSVAFPKLGTNNGGLNWDVVKDLMEHYLKDISDLNIFVCLDSSEPRGTEARMLSIASRLSETKLRDLGLRANAIDNFMSQVPFKRFFHISKVKGLGIKSYEKLHRYCYQKAQKSEKELDNDIEQILLF